MIMLDTFARFVVAVFVVMDSSIYVAGYIVTDFGSRDVMQTILNDMKMKYAEYRSLENPLSDMNRENRIALCTNMLQASYFRRNGLREANKRNLFIRVHLRNMHPASYELHYFEERSNFEPELIYPVLLMTISSTPFSQELVLPCLAEEYSSGILNEFFISRGYNDGMFFVYERSTTRHLLPVAIMERGRALVDFAGQDFELEEHYVTHRSLLGMELDIVPQARRETLWLIRQPPRVARIMLPGEKYILIHNCIQAVKMRWGYIPPTRIDYLKKK